jgi:hypothetical protein
MAAGIEELIGRLEAATEGSAELDQAISICLTGQGESYRPCTRNIDSALTLVSEGWWAAISHGADRHSCVLWEFPLPCRRVPKSVPFVVAARTTPLAICIAALHARALAFAPDAAGEKQ